MSQHRMARQKTCENVLTSFSHCSIQFTCKGRSKTKVESIEKAIYFQFLYVIFVLEDLPIKQVTIYAVRLIRLTPHLTV